MPTLYNYFTSSYILFQNLKELIYLHIFYSKKILFFIKPLIKKEVNKNEIRKCEIIFI